MNPRAYIASLCVVLSCLLLFGCGGKNTPAGNSPAQSPRGGASSPAAEPSAPAQPIVQPAIWIGRATNVPVHGADLSEVIFNLDKETAGGRLNFVIYNVGSYSAATLPPGATLKDLMDIAFNRWRVFFYNDPNALVIATSVDYGHVQSIVNRVSDVFTSLGDAEKSWQRPCRELSVRNGSSAQLAKYLATLDPKGKYKVEGTPPALRIDLFLTDIPLEQALTYLAWASGADISFSSTGVLYFQFK